MKIYEVRFDKVVQEEDLEIVKTNAIRFDDWNDANNYVDGLRYATDLKLGVHFENIGLREISL